jgi:predicted GH43/DUF377 family glycosyl hydrolase
MLKFTRCPENPIVRPGLYDWRMATVFNPGVLYEDGKFFLYERTAGKLRPFHCYIGMLESDDGVHFRHVTDRPVLTPEMAGSPYGSVQDPRVVKIEDTYYMTYAFRPYAWNYHPTGLGVPEHSAPDFPGFSGKPEDTQSRSGIAVSKDRVHWEHFCWATPLELDDRDVILFPEKVNGRFAMLRRPLQFVGPEYGADRPSIWICFSEDLQKWSKPELIAKPENQWESNRIGGSTPPIRTDEGWLVLYHGVETEHEATRRVIYRLGAMLLDLDDPRKVIARTRDPIMQPEEYYERFGLYIPNVIFPTGAVVPRRQPVGFGESGDRACKDDLLYLYYGVCDTAIALATTPLNDLLTHLLTA